MSDFFQAPPVLMNTYNHGLWLKRYLRAKLPPEIFMNFSPELESLGADCAGPYLELARAAEREKPQHVPFTAFGERRDEIRVSPAWIELQKISAREKMIALAYERPFAEYSRLCQFAKLYLFHPSSAFFSCPLAMTDGAAKVLSKNLTSPKLKDAFARLTSKDPETFITSGQWMTEKTGGSDVSGTSTVVRHEEGQVRLYGTKWFSSATTSAMALALGREEDGTLSLFHVDTYSAPGVLNHIKVLRLKDKLGTWALPTAELQLEGAYATPVGDKGKGVKTVATMLNITRLYNSVCSIGQTARALEQLRDYSEKREAFGKKLNAHILHASCFAAEEANHLAGFLLTFELVHLLGKEENDKATPEESDLLRLMTPVTKLFTARAAIRSASEAIEGFGGVGYIEDSGMPVHLRDAQVFPIWEGATNVLSHDLLRVIAKGTALQSLLKTRAYKLKSARATGELATFVAQAETREKDFSGTLHRWSSLAPELQEASARDLAFFLARDFAAVALLDWAARSHSDRAELLPWLTYFSGSWLEPWRLKSAEDCARARQMWKGPSPI